MASREFGPHEVHETGDDKRTVARLVPLGGNPLEHLVAEGLARPARRRARDLPPPLPASGPALSELLAEARRDER